MHTKNNVKLANNARINVNTNSHSQQACAACKYQRRKCPSDCILAPYFPHNRQTQFLNAHKLFGVSNITKIIRDLDPPQKDAAMRTIIFQSDVRANDPVGGCYTLVRNLERQIDYAKAELDVVLRQLALCRAAEAQAQAQHHHQMQQLHLHDDCHHDSSSASPRRLNDIHINNNSSHDHDIFGAEAEHLGSYEHQIFDNNYYQLLQPQYHHEKDNIDNDSCPNINNDSWLGMQQQGSISSSCIPPGKQRSLSDQCYNFNPLLDDPKDSRFESQVNFHPRDEATADTSKEDEESFQCCGDHDLKRAAALFTLTKCDSS